MAVHEIISNLLNSFCSCTYTVHGLIRTLKLKLNVFDFVGNDDDDNYGF